MAVRFNHRVLIQALQGGTVQVVLKKICTYAFAFLSAYEDVGPRQPSVGNSAPFE